MAIQLYLQAVTHPTVMNHNTAWFEVWFDSPYYHLLYQHRSESEAQGFISNLAEVLDLKKGARILDMGCGAGRHSILLNKLGFDVTGIDLSAANIEKASESKEPGLQFVQQDMRYPLPGQSFDAIFNLFTSFGYFDNPEENMRVLKSAHQMLVPNGIFVLDFLNAKRAIEDLIPEETTILEGTRFDVSRAIENGIITKKISVDNNPDLQFEERVQAFSKSELEEMLRHAGFEPQKTFGSYDMTPFNIEHADRLIIIAQKK